MSDSQGIPLRFAFALDADHALELYAPSTARGMHETITRNLDRLREWEQWAQVEQSYDDLVAFTSSQIAGWVAGTVVPCVFVAHRCPAGKAAPGYIGSISLRLNRAQRTAELGYWIDAEFEGRGLVTRACEALIEHGKSVGVQRFEIRAATTNTRSIAVARRLGFEQEGVLHRAMPVGDRVHDAALFSLIV